MAIFDMSQFSGNIAPLLKGTLGLLWQIVQLLLFLGALVYIWFYMSFNQRILERKYTKGGRVIATIKRAKKVFDKKLGHPQLQYFGILGFAGKKINEPPADCITPFSSMFGNTTLYDFIIKEGIFYPVANAVLGRKYIVDSNAGLQQDDIFMAWAAENGIQVNSVGNPTTTVYSIEGSGLEVSRDFDAEQSTLNNLINAADKYKNRKPVEIAAMYGLMIIISVGSFITLIYVFYKVGSITDAINKGWEMFGEIGGKAVEQRLGPG